MAIDPEELFLRQEKEYSKFAEGEVLRFIRLLEDARRELEGQISDLESFESRRVIALLGQIDVIERETLRNINNTGPVDKRSGELAVTQSSEAYAAMGLDVSVTFDRINPVILRNFARLSLDKIKAAPVESLNTIRSVLLTKIGVKGENPRKVAKYLAGKEGLFTNNYARLENIVRTETAHVYNGQKLESIKSAVEQGVALNKRIIETIDYKRNHPISQVLNNKVQKPGEQFRVKVADVAAACRHLKRGLDKGGNPTGIFWERRGEYYVGNNLPAHYMDRGVLVPTQKEPNTQ